ncbi:unnamed protein product [Brachionus calyciflorus]|uniref:Uncharacterized protein n=1 Tax=Brachionus calyciflorus TaxID=104777 RepID=A0A814AUW1_9BILA|nr:unnamed protein product [Brachionus calyciflorus]
MKLFILGIFIFLNFGSIQNSEEKKCILINRHESRYLSANNWFVTFLIGNQVYASEMDRNEYKTVLDWYINRPEAVWIFQPIGEYGPVSLKSVKSKNELNEESVWYFRDGTFYYEIMNSKFKQSLFIKPVKVERRLNYVVRLLDYDNYDLDYDAGDIHQKWNLRCENEKSLNI